MSAPTVPWLTLPSLSAVVRSALLHSDGVTRSRVLMVTGRGGGTVGLYRMQSMNQSLVALLVHQKITYQDAMALASDPDDLSLTMYQMLMTDGLPWQQQGLAALEIAGPLVMMW